MTVPTGGFRLGYLTVEAAARALAPRVFLSDEIDLTTVADHPWGGNWPDLPGFKLIWTGCRAVITNVAATSFAVQPVISVGCNGAMNDILASVAPVSLANLTAFLAIGSGGPYYASAFPTIAGGANGKTPDLTTPPHIRVSTAASGVAVTQCKMRLVLSGLLSSVFPTI